METEYKEVSGQVVKKRSRVAPQVMEEHVICAWVKDLIELNIAMGEAAFHQGLARTGIAEIPVDPKAVDALVRALADYASSCPGCEMYMKECMGSEFCGLTPLGIQGILAQTLVEMGLKHALLRNRFGNLFNTLERFQELEKIAEIDPDQVPAFLKVPTEMGIGMRFEDGSVTLVLGRAVAKGQDGLGKPCDVWTLVSGPAPTEETLAGGEDSTGAVNMITVEREEGETLTAALTRGLAEGTQLAFFPTKDEEKSNGQN
jgi:hypothetical protein